MYSDMLKELPKEEPISEPLEKNEIEEEIKTFIHEENQHKKLPHLSGKRIYDNFSNILDKSEQGIAENNKEEEKLVIKKQNSQLDLNNIPRIKPLEAENSIHGIYFVNKIEPDVLPIPQVPLSINNFTCINTQNTIPRYMRPNMRILLNDGNNFYKNTGLGLGISIQPFSEIKRCEKMLETVKNSEKEEILRCKRCGAYVNPGFLFSEANTKFQCNLCESIGNLDCGYFEGDGVEKCELRHGSYEFIAGPELQGKPINGNNIVIVIECTNISLEHGILIKLIYKYRVSKPNCSILKINFNYFTLSGKYQHFHYYL